MTLKMISVVLIMKKLGINYKLLLVIQWIRGVKKQNWFNPLVLHVYTINAWLHISLRNRLKEKDTEVFRNKIIYLIRFVFREDIRFHDQVFYRYSGKTSRNVIHILNMCKTQRIGLKKLIRSDFFLKNISNHKLLINIFKKSQLVIIEGDPTFPIC